MQKIRMIFLCISFSQLFFGQVQQNTAVNHNSKIQVLNLGTFHMGETPDANKVDFDEKDNKNQEELREIAKKLAQFKPTVILVETPPSYDTKLQKDYATYLANPKTQFKDPNEIELLAFEIGRIAGCSKIFGIDYQMDYNYNIGFEISNAVDSVWYNKFFKDPRSFYPKIHQDDTKLSTLEKLKNINQAQFLDFLIAVNADMLAHAGTENNFEGADEAAKYYQRNLRMYTILNRLKITQTDRVFILMGATHTSFFKEFFSRSPKFEMVDTFEYLK
jgi:hypothetical protein